MITEESCGFVCLSASTLRTLEFWDSGWVSSKNLSSAKPGVLGVRVLWFRWGGRTLLWHTTAVPLRNPFCYFKGLGKYHL